MTSFTKLAALAGGLAMTAGLLVGGAGSAGAAGQGVRVACYDRAVDFTKAAGRTQYPSVGYLVTSRYCDDINLKLNNGLFSVRVCFYPSSGGVDCQSRYKLIGSSWTEVATNVLDGTKYRFEFSYSGEITGTYAD